MSALPKADIGQLNDLTDGGSVEARADATILVAERECVASHRLESIDDGNRSSVPFMSV
jgi:hypothetical protein